MKKGFTLIEVLVATAIFTLVIIAFIGIFVTVTGVQVRQNSAAAVNEESQFLLQKIQYYIRAVQFGFVDAGSCDLDVTLRMPSSSIDPDDSQLVQRNGLSPARERHAPAPDLKQGFRFESSFHAAVERAGA